MISICQVDGLPLLHRVLLQFSFVPLFATYLPVTTFCLIHCLYLQVGCIPQSWRSDICRKCPVGSSSAIPSGHQSYVIYRCLLCGLRGFCPCDWLPTIGTLAGVAGPGLVGLLVSAGQAGPDPGGSGCTAEGIPLLLLVSCWVGLILFFFFLFLN